MSTPIWLVTEFRRTKRSSPACKYAAKSEKVDLWKVGLTHGYYAGMGMNFFFETQEQASRLSLWTIYDPSELIDALDNRTFTVQSITKTYQMSAPSQYTDLRTLVDSWKVSFEGEQNDFLDQFFPWEAVARSYSFGRPYTMGGLLGTLPAIPRDVRAQLEAYAEMRRRADEDRELEFARQYFPGNSDDMALMLYRGVLAPSLDTGVSPDEPTPSGPAYPNYGYLGLGPESNSLTYLQALAQAEEGMTPKDAYFFELGDLSDDLKQQFWDLYQQIGGPTDASDPNLFTTRYPGSSPATPSPTQPGYVPPTYVPPDLPTQNPQPPGPQNPGGVEVLKASAKAQVWRITNGGASGWYAATSDHFGTSTYTQLASQGKVGLWYHMAQGGVSISGSPQLMIFSNQQNISVVPTTGQTNVTFSWYGFFVQDQDVSNTQTTPTFTLNL